MPISVVKNISARHVTAGTLVLDGTRGARAAKTVTVGRKFATIQFSDWMKPSVMRVPLEQVVKIRVEEKTQEEKDAEQREWVSRSLRHDMEAVLSAEPRSLSADSLSWDILERVLSQGQARKIWARVQRLTDAGNDILAAVALQTRESENVIRRAAERMGSQSTSAASNLIDASEARTHAEFLRNWGVNTDAVRKAMPAGE